MLHDIVLPRMYIKAQSTLRLLGFLLSCLLALGWLTYDSFAQENCAWSWWCLVLLLFGEGTEAESLQIATSFQAIVSKRYRDTECNAMQWNILLSAPAAVYFQNWSLS